MKMHLLSRIPSILSSGSLAACLLPADITPPLPRVLGLTAHIITCGVEEYLGKINDNLH